VLAVGNVTKPRQGRDPMDADCLSLVRRQLSSPSASRARPQSRQLPAHDARTNQRLVADEPQRKLIKIGGKVVSHGRYVAFQMAEVAVPRYLFADVLRRVAQLRPPPVTSTA
jgi:hypothetical protein